MKDTISLTEAKRALWRAYDIERATGERIVIAMNGAPGQGKTSIGHQFTHELSAFRLARGLSPARLWSNRISQCDPTDLKGCPVFEKRGSAMVTTYAAPSNFPLLGHPETAGGDFVTILMDEYKQATQVMQNLAANIIDGVVGDYLLDPERSLLVLAGNRKEDRAAVFETPTNVKTRVVWLNVACTFEEWSAWAYSKKLHPSVIGYLQEHSAIFNMLPPADGSTYGNPRTWHKVACDMETLGDRWFSDPLTPSFLTGMVGPAAASDFLAFASKRSADYSVEEVWANGTCKVPTEADVLYSMVIEMAYRIDDAVASVPVVEDLAGSLTDAQIRGINNCYTWLSEHCRERAFNVLVNRYQSEDTRIRLRPLFITNPAFRPAGQAFARMAKDLTRQAG